MAFLTQNLETLSPRLSNPFWTQVLERWKAIRPKLYTNPNDIMHTNICNSTDSHRLPQTPTDSCRLPQTPTDSHRLPQTPTDSHTLPQTPTDSHRLPQTPTDSHRLPHTPTDSHRLP